MVLILRMSCCELVQSFVVVFGTNKLGLGNGRTRTKLITLCPGSIEMEKKTSSIISKNSYFDRCDMFNIVTFVTELF